MASFFAGAVLCNLLIAEVLVCSAAPVLLGVYTQVSSELVNNDSIFVTCELTVTVSFNRSHWTCLIKLLLSWVGTATVCQGLWLLKCPSFQSRPKGLLGFISEFKQDLQQHCLLSPVVSLCVHFMNNCRHLADTTVFFFVHLHGNKPKMCTLQHHFLLNEHLLDVHCYSK